MFYSTRATARCQCVLTKGNINVASSADIISVASRTRPSFGAGCGRAAAASRPTRAAAATSLARRPDVAIADARERQGAGSRPGREDQEGPGAEAALIRERNDRMA